MYFTDRTDAGRRLAARLDRAAADAVVLGLPRGGVPVAAEVAAALGAPLDVVLVRKLGVPFQPELAMGAIGEGGVRVVNHEVLRRARVSQHELERVERRERAELERRAALYRGGRPRIDVRGRTVVVVDDGVATGSTALAACRVAREQGAARIVLAVPVAPPGRVAALEQVADEVVCLSTPVDFFGVGQFYADFGQTTDQEVIDCLRVSPAPADRAAPGGPPPDDRSGDAPAERATDAATAAASERPGTGRADGGRAGAAHAGTDQAWGRETGEAGTRAGRPAEARDGEARAVDRDAAVPTGTAVLAGRLTVPAGARGLVVFAHGSGSSRHSPRNRFVAEALNRAGLGTLLFDLLTEDEELDRSNVFDTGLLARRLAEATRWLRGQPEARGLPVGYFGASTGAAAALTAAAAPHARVAAVVSRSGRPDLAGPQLAAVRAPTLLVVGGRDALVLDLNRRAQLRLRCENRLAVVPGAGHLFEEPGTLASVAELATRWFTDHLSPARAGAA